MDPDREVGLSGTARGFSAIAEAMVESPVAVAADVPLVTSQGFVLGADIMEESSFFVTMILVIKMSR